MSKKQLDLILSINHYATITTVINFNLQLKPFNVPGVKNLSLPLNNEMFNSYRFKEKSCLFLSSIFNYD